jgi:hypothetical protein
VNSVIVDKTSKDKITITNACTPPDEGGALGGTRRRGTAGTAGTAGQNSSSQSWVTPGAIAGIAVGCAVVVGVVAFTIWWFVHPKRKTSV